MPTLYFRDPNTGQMVPVLGSMTQAEADARYLQKTGGTMSGALNVPTTPTSSTSIASKTYTDSRKIPAGTIVHFAGPNLPSGWTWCNGTLLRRDEYADLFAAIGVTYGVGDGVTTFASPNIQGRIMVGRHTGYGEFTTLGGVAGGYAASVDISQVPNASGRVVMHNAGSTTMVWNSTGNLAPHSWAANYRTGYQNPGSAQGAMNMNLGYGGYAHENTMPSIMLNAIIKT